MLACWAACRRARLPRTPSCARVRSRPLSSDDPWLLEFTDGERQPGPRRASGHRHGAVGHARLSHRDRVEPRHRGHRLGGRGRRLHRAARDDRSPPHDQRRASARGKGVIALDARLEGPTAGVRGDGHGLRRGRGRALPRLRRALEPGRPGGLQRSRTTSPTVPTRPTSTPGIALFVPPWGLRDGREDATYFPIPWLLSSEGYGVLVDNPETSTFRLGSDDAGAWSVEVTPAPPGEAGAELAPPVDRLQLRFFAGPSPAKALQRFTRGGRPPAPGRRRPGSTGPWFQPGGSDAEDLATLRDADAPGLRLSDLHALPALRRAGDGRRAGTRPGGARRRRRDHDLLQPDGLRELRAALRPGRGRRRADRDTGSALPYTYRYGANIDDLFVVGQYDFFEPAGRELYGDALLERRSATATTAGWRTSASTRRSTRSRTSRSTAPAPTTSTRAATTAPPGTRSRTSSRPIVRFQRSGWTGAAKCAQVVWGGDPDHGLGLRRPALGGDPGAQRRHLRHRHLGLGHRRLLRPRRATRSRPSSSRAGSSSAPSRA